MRALVTGGAGFVGRHLCTTLLERGWEVVCVDPIVPGTGGRPPELWSFGSPLDFKAFTFLREDCRNFFARSRRESFDYAFHIAAIVGGRLTIEFDPLAVAEDLAIDALYWQWAKNARPGKTITFSSSAAYPISLQRRDHYRLLKEEDVNFVDRLGIPDMTYGWAKVTAEYLGRLAFEKYGLHSVAYRPFSGYGEDQDANYPIPSIVKRALELDGDEMIIWGSGQQMRDFIHIDDCIACILGTMNQIENGSAINISSGRLISFAHLARMVLDKLGKGARIVAQHDKPEGVFARGGDRTLQAKLGFTPEIDLASGIGRVVQHLGS